MCGVAQIYLNAEFVEARVRTRERGDGGEGGQSCFGRPVRSGCRFWIILLLNTSTEVLAGPNRSQELPEGKVSESEPEGTREPVLASGLQSTG